MDKFTAWEYLLIDAANQFGHDKLPFQERLDWAYKHLDELEKMKPVQKPEDEEENDVITFEWKEQPLYEKAVRAIRKVQEGRPTGHLVGFDAICSGLQIMSALTGCRSGAEATGLVDPDVRSDAYTQCLKLMKKYIPTLQDEERANIKQACMTMLYGSKKVPEELFGKGTKELEVFYLAMMEMAPGACELLETLKESWNPYALTHEWKLPDGFDARVKVMQGKKARIKVDELDGASFTYIYYENQGLKRDVSNVANVVHSIDAYVLRSLERRCNYKRYEVEHALSVMLTEALRREMGTEKPHLMPVDEDFAYYVEQYNRSSVADVVIFPFINRDNVMHLSEVHLDKLITLAEGMLEYKPFPMVTVHDEFKCLAGNMNHLRNQYRNILADLADSQVLDDILSQVFGFAGNFPRRSNNLGITIRKSNYALT